MAAHDSGFSGECHEDGDNRDGHEHLLEPLPLLPVPEDGERDLVSVGDKNTGAAGAPSDLCDNSRGDTLEDELIEEEKNNPGQDDDNVEKTSQELDKVEEEDVEPPGEEEIEIMQEIPVVRLRSRSSSSSSTSSHSRSRSRSRSRRRSYSTDEDIEIIEDSTTRKDSERSPNSTRKSSEAQNTEDAGGVDEDILEVEVIKSNTVDHRRSSSQDRQDRSNRRKSREREVSRSGEQNDSRNSSYSSSSRDRHPHNYREERRYPSVSSATSTSGAYNRDMSNRGSQPSRNYRDWKRGRQHSGNDPAWNRGTEARNNGMTNPFSVPPPNYPYHRDGEYNTGSQQQPSYPEPPPGYPKIPVEDSSGVRCESLTFSDGYDCHSFSSSSARAHVDVRNLSPVVSGGGGETLRAGNYLLLTWDCESLGGSHYQLACQSYHGDRLLLCLVPDTEVGLNLAKHHFHCPLVTMSGRPYVRHTNTGQFQQCLEPGEALVRLLDFLEKSKNRTRPSYDGLVLLSHSLHSLTGLVKSVRKHNLYQRFSQLVSAVGSLTNFLLKKNVRGVTDSSSLEVCYHAVFQRKMYPLHPMSDDRARICFEIVGKVLDSPPSFRNLFSACCQPLTSSEVQRMLSFRTREEKLEMFERLEANIRAELERQQRESRAGETFYPGQADSGEDSPALTARQIVQQLVEVGFQFEQLLEIARQRGVGNLELQVRTAFLGQMAGQSRRVVDQSILATRLVVRYFRDQAHKPLEQIIRPSPQPPQRQEVRTQVERGGRDGGDEGCDYQDLISYLGSRYSHSQEMKSVARISVEILSTAGLTAESLVSVVSSGQSLDWLVSQLSALRTKCPGVNVRNLARNICDWTSTKRRRRFGRPGVSRDLQPVYNSLVAFKQFLVRYLPKALTDAGDQIGNMRELELLAEEYHKSISYLGFTHFHLKTEFDKGESSFKLRLRKNLNEIHAEISSDVNLDVLVGLAVRYFRVNF